MAAFAALAALLTHRLQLAYPTFVTRTSRLDATPYPHLFLCELLVEVRIGLRFDLQLQRLLDDEVVVVAWPGTELPTIEFDDPGGEPVDEGAIVTDKKQRTAELQHHLFEPFDGLDVEMIGRLVEQQDVRVTDERPSEQGTTLPATGKFRKSAAGIESESTHYRLDAIADLPTLARRGRQSAANDFIDECVFDDVQILGEHRESRTGLDPYAAVIRR
jgi:hypothetical protein